MAGIRGWRRALWRRALVVGLGATVLVLALAGSASAGHVPGGAYYVSNTGVGGSVGAVSITVSPDGSSVTRFAVGGPIDSITIPLGEDCYPGHPGFEAVSLPIDGNHSFSGLYTYPGPFAPVASFQGSFKTAKPNAAPPSSFARGSLRIGGCAPIEWYTPGPKVSWEVCDRWLWAAAKARKQLRKADTPAARAKAKKKLKRANRKRNEACPPPGSEPIA